MWFTIILGVIVVIAIICTLVIADNNEAGFPGIVAIIGVILLTVSSAFVFYHRGFAANLQNLPPGLIKGEVYTVIAYSTNGYAVVTDRSFPECYQNYGSRTNGAWLIDLGQNTNVSVVVGNRYMITENSKGARENFTLRTLSEVK